MHVQDDICFLSGFLKKAHERIAILLRGGGGAAEIRAGAAGASDFQQNGAFIFRKTVNRGSE